MPLYQVSGKWYHREYSHGVREVMEAALPASALKLFIESILGFTEDDEPGLGLQAFACQVWTPRTATAFLGWW